MESPYPAVLAAFAERLQQGDVEGWVALFTEDAAYDEPPVHHFTGREQLRAFEADFAARHTDVSFTISRTVVDASGTRVAAEWRFSYVSLSDGGRHTFEGISMLDLRDGLIASWRGFSTHLPTT